MVVGGLICDLIGTINLVSVPSKAKSVIRNYNSAQASTLTVGQTSNGIGLAFNF